MEILIMNNNLPAKAKVGRPTKAESLMRIRECAAMLLTSRPRSEILEHFCTKYGIQETSVANIVTNAYIYIKETHAHDKEGLLYAQLEKYYDVYRLAMSLGDARGANQALNSVDKLMKLVLPDTAIQNNNFNFDVSKMSLSELKELISSKDETKTN